jgi:hypothetical protein
MRTKLDGWRCIPSGLSLLRQAVEVAQKPISVFWFGEIRFRAGETAFGPYVAFYAFKDFAGHFGGRITPSPMHFFSVSRFGFNLFRCHRFKLVLTLVFHS